MGKEPDDYKPYGGRGQVLVELSRFDEAVRDLNHALKLVHRSSEEFSYRVQLQALLTTAKLPRWPVSAKMILQSKNLRIRSICNPITRGSTLIASNFMNETTTLRPRPQPIASRLTRKNLP